MPDRNSAASEHALIAEITAPLSTLPDDPVSLTADVDFPIVLRGYDRLAVDAYVRRTSQLVAELQATRSPEAAVRRALERVGDEIAGVLQRAHETAEDITARSRSEAEDRLEMSRREAENIVASAEQRVRDLDDETERIWAERHRIVDDARDLASQLLALAQSAAERFPEAEEGPEPEPEHEEPDVFSDTGVEPADTEEDETAEAEEDETAEPASPAADASFLDSTEPLVQPSDDTEPTLEKDPDPDATAPMPRLTHEEDDTLGRDR